MTTSRAPGATLCLLTMAALALAACSRPAPKPAAEAPATDALAWAYPGAGAPPATGFSKTDKVGLEGVAVSHSPAEIHDRYNAVDWRPTEHPTAPAIVMHGRAPDAMACGFCHLPDGQGRPENAALAGLPAAYIEAQLANMRTGDRQGARPGWLPSALMTKEARSTTPAEAAAAAAYFSKLPYTPRVRLVETADIPRTEGFGFLNRPAGGGGREALGTRIIEVPDDVARWEKRDSRVGYVAYAPVGALARGQALASGAGGQAPACASCHGEGLRGGPAAPPIAGRTPGYLFRQLTAFKAGARHGAQDAPMVEVTRTMTPAQMVDVAAYAASLKP